jgi:hypothetical protein
VGDCSLLIVLGDQGYSEEDTFDWLCGKALCGKALCGKAQILRVMPSDEGKDGLSTVSQVSIISQVLAAHRK